MSFAVYPIIKFCYSSRWRYSQLGEAMTRGESKTGLCLKMLLLPYPRCCCLGSNS